MYKVIKWIKGRAYLYLQRGYRLNGKVKTECRCLGAATPADIASYGKKGKVSTSEKIKGRPLGYSGGWGESKLQIDPLPLDSNINFKELKLDGHALYKEWEYSCLNLRKMGVKADKIPTIKLRYGEKITHKKDWFRNSYTVTIPKHEKYQRTKFKREFSKAVARVSLDILREQKPEKFLELSYKFDQSFRATQNALNTYILQSKDRNKQYKAIALRFWGQAAQLQKNIPNLEQGPKGKLQKVGIVDYSERKSWEDETVAIMASIQHNGLETFIEETKRETRYAKTDLEAAKEEFKSAWGNEWINPYKAKAKQKLIRQEARYKAQEEMIRKVRLIRSAFFLPLPDQSLPF